MMFSYFPKSKCMSMSSDKSVFTNIRSMWISAYKSYCPAYLTADLATQTVGEVSFIWHHHFHHNHTFMHLSVYILFQCLLNNPDKDIPESFSNSVCGVEKEFAAHSTDLFSFCRFPQLLKQHRLVILYVSGVLATAEMHFFLKNTMFFWLSNLKTPYSTPKVVLPRGSGPLAQEQNDVRD